MGSIRLLAIFLSAITLWCADSYTISTAAGGSFVGDAGPAAKALLVQPEGIAVDLGGNVYVADAAENRVRRIAVDGLITTLAGTGTAGFTGDGTPSSRASLNAPYGICTDRVGNLYIADLGNARVRRVGPDGVITTFAGGGSNTPEDGRQAADVKLLAPRNVAMDPQGNLYIADFQGHRVYRVSPMGMIATIAGSGTAGFSGDGASAVRANLAFPAGLAVDSQGVLYIADSGNKRIRRVYQGVISTVGDLGRTGGSTLPLNTPTGVAVDTSDNLYVADGRPTMLKLTPAGTLTAVQTGGSAVSLDAAGNIYSAGSYGVRRLSGGVATLLVPLQTGLFGGDGGPAGNGRLSSPLGLASDNSGSLYIADRDNGRIRKVNSYGTLSTMSTAIAHPGSIALDSFGNVFVSDATANRIYRVAADGRATPFAGVDKPGFGGDQGPALQSVLASPSGLAFDALDSLYFADTGSGRIRKISPGGWISTVAGGGTREGDGIASESALSQPAGVAIDNQGTLFFSESGANRIRSLSRSGLLTTVADAASANLLRPGGLRVAPNGDIYVADAGNHRIRHIPAVGPATTIAGNGAPGFSGDDGPAAAAKLSSPSDVALDSAGNIWISDTGNNRIRKLTREPSTPGVGQISTVSVTHAATFKEQAVAPGEILSIFGSGLGPVVGAIAKLTSAGILETQVAEVQVLFDGRPAPLFYVQDQQINVQALYALSAQRSTEITVVYRGLVAARATLAVQDSVPGLLTLAGGTGQAVVMNENGVTNGMDSPASRGAVVVFYATGDGQLGADALDGKPAVFSPSSASVAVDIAGYPGEILYAGRAPGFVGLMQINVRLPAALAATGLQPITLSVNGAKSQPGVVLALQ